MAWAARLLLGGGLVLVVAGLVVGEWFALARSHAINADLRASWLEVLANAGQGDYSGLLPRFEDIQRLAADRARSMSLHSHIGPYGLLAASLALVKIRLGRPGRFDLPAAALILTGAVVQSIGFLSMNYAAGDWLSPSNAGAVLLVLGIVLYLPGLMPRGSVPVALPGPRATGGTLLRAGIVVILAGLLFGLYLAWHHVFNEEPALHAALHDLVEAVSRADAAAAQVLYGTYKSTQIRMAITAAAHSHAVAGGFIMVVAAGAASFANLTPRWWAGAASLIAAGCVLMPVFVYLAPRFGYAFALCADTAGGLVIVGLSILLVGLFPKRSEGP